MERIIKRRPSDSEDYQFFLEDKFQEEYMPQIYSAEVDALQEYYEEMWEAWYDTMLSLRY